MPSVRQYDRGVRVRLFPPVGLGDDVELVVNREVPLAGLPTVPQLGLAFTVSKTLTPEPNVASVRIYNLTPTTRDRISGTVRRLVDWLPTEAVVKVDGVLRAGGNEVTSTLAGMCALRLEAGYSGALGQIFSGTVTRQRTYPQGSDTITELVCTDGGFQIAAATANRVFAPKTPAGAVAQYLAQVMGLELGQSQGLAQLSGFTLQSGLHCTGDPQRGLADIVAVLGLGWWIEDGRVWILAEGETLPDDGDPPVVSQQVIPGAIRLWSTPEVLDQGGLRIRCTLAPGIRLGHAVVVAGGDHRGTYRVESVQHGGYNRGGTFETAAVIRNPAAVF